MKKLLCTVLVICMLISLAACGGKKQETAAEGFKPALDTKTSCSITVAGSYDNFEALEAEFDRFNEFYPDVQMSYVKLDDYNNILATTLDGSDSPNIFFSYSWMRGNEKYDPVFAHMEDLSDAALGLDLDIIRPRLISRDAKGQVLMVPIFTRTYGMLVNNDLFEKEGLNVPKIWSELLAVCEELRGKGYASPMMGYSAKPASSFMNSVAYTLFVAALADNPEAIDLANRQDPAAGEYMRPALETIEQLLGSGCIDLEECDKIEDNYSKVILRFFEGDVPMMICTGDTVSGTKKRESQSEAFTASPFDYSFFPLPITEDGGYFIDSPSLEFSVNKDCDDLDMTNEFMRFLITDSVLSEMASVKRLVTPTSDLAFDPVYAPFGQVPSDRIISPEMLGILDTVAVQTRAAAFLVGTGEITVDEAVKMYGQFE
ncbi:MAG: carbohydrate ABC transporter substrate-binding protein [Firmicutes bacterium]|nr:carbohydrate ABC transporter substrate-binding protein [Bacillota bacterium]